jgi:hypothetical protein
MRRLLCTISIWLGLVGSTLAQESTVRGNALPVLIPNLERIVDTYIPIASSDPDEYYSQLRAEVIPHIRTLQENNTIRWYAFLVHGADQIGERVPAEGDATYIHLFLEPGIGLEFDDFVSRLPIHFFNPESRPLGSFAGVDGAAIRDGNWAYGWKGIGEASEFVLRLLENYGDNPIPQENILQFIHFVTNALYLGSRSLFLPEGPAIRF